MATLLMIAIDLTNVLSYYCKVWHIGYAVGTVIRAVLG